VQLLRLLRTMVILVGLQLRPRGFPNMAQLHFTYRCGLTAVVVGQLAVCGRDKGFFLESG